MVRWGGMDRYPWAIEPDSGGGSEVATNLPDVDAAWPSLIRSCTSLCDALAAPGRSDAIENAFQDVIERAIEIFRREESVIDASYDPQGIVHRQGHLNVLSTLSGLRQSYKANGGSPEIACRTRVDLLDFLKEHHVLLDALLGRHVRDWSSRGEVDDD